MRPFFSLFWLFSLICAVTAAPRRKIDLQRDTQTQRDIAFARRGDRALQLQLVRPQILPPRPLPVVIWVHGGLWRAGSSAKIPPLAFELARHGFAVASVDFRSSREAVFPAQLDDLRAATRFLRQNASSYSLDAAEIGVAGVSTGAHLAALLGLSGGIQAVADICGPTDLTTLETGSRLDWNEETQGPLFALLGGAAAQKMDLAREASPLFRVSRPAPPFLVLHGDSDSLVSVRQSQALVL